MIQLFYNDSKIILSESATVQSGNNISFADLRKKGTDNLLRSIEDTSKGGEIIIQGKSEEKMLGYFKKSLIEITAGGGLVQNTGEDILFIFRNGKWDLPKGKPEGHESIEETALREVEEECGISELEIMGNLPATYHIYPLATKGYVLKKSVWFHMRYYGNQPLIAQTDEGITEARWVKTPVPEDLLQNAFPSIKSLMDFFTDNYLRGPRS